jgi:hypothetical protein
MQRSQPACSSCCLATLLVIGRISLSLKITATASCCLLLLLAPATAAAAGCAAADCPISVQDEAQLKLYYQVKLKAICEQLKVPSKVLVRSHGCQQLPQQNISGQAERA